MRNRILLLFLLPGALCGGQTTPTAPGADTTVCPTGPGPVPEGLEAVCPPATSTIPNPGTTVYPQGTNPQAGTLPSGANSVPVPAPTVPIPYKVVGPITARTEFQIFAEDEAGHPLQVFGRKLFDEVPTTFAPLDRIPVPANYVLGPGDELLIHVWGKIDLDTRVTVDRNGQVFVPTIGNLTVAGLRFDQLQSFLHSAIATLYKDFDLNVSLGQLRSIQVFVLGSARQPGVYTISSLSTLVNALFTSGGPSATGSMRHIQLRRSDQVITEFDLYDLLRRGDKSHDVQLLPGDVIYIPPAGQQVAIIGSVNEPGIYEIKGDETVASALEDAGGATNLADQDRVLLERIENHEGRQLESFAMDEAGLKRTLRDGDLLRVYPLSPRFDNAVTLRGNVAQPGRYSYRDGMRVSDLIPNRQFLLTRDYWNQQNFLVPERIAHPFGLAPNQFDPQTGTNVQNPANLPSGVNPQNQFNSQNGFNPQAGTNPQAGNNAQPSQNVQPATNMQPGNNVPNGINQQTGTNVQSGSNQQQGTSQQNANNTQIDAGQRSETSFEAARNGEEINWDYAAIERLDQHDLSTRLIAFNLGNAIDNPASPDNPVLEPGDVVTIFSEKDIPLPVDKHAAFVRVDGEVNAPGIYRIGPGETLRDVVKRAGGLTPHSYLYASQLNRISTRRAEELEIRQSTAQMQRDLLARNAATSTVGTSNTAEQQAQLSSQQALIAQLAAVQPTGRVVLAMKPDAGSVDDIPAFPLEDGDTFYIPPELNTVQVSGAVYNENAFRYEGKKRLNSYLNDAGGPTRQADTKRVFLIRADGTVISRQTHGEFWHSDFGSTTLLPGDAIIVPPKLKGPSTFIQQLPYFTQILSQTALTGAVLGTAY
jgi:protein involved in polysaccharide export with SLBB domain